MDRPAPQKSPASGRTSEDALLRRGARMENLARLVATVGQPTRRAEAAQRIAEAARQLLGSTAAAIFLGNGSGQPLRAALSGFTLVPPEGLPATLTPPDLAALFDWSTRNGMAPVEFAPLEVQTHRLGMLVLFGGDVEPLTESDLRVVGELAAHVLEQARTLDDLRRAYESQERTQDQVVRTERLRVLGEMALGIAHDFNNVLNAVLGQVGVLELLSASGPTLEPLRLPVDRLKAVALEGASTVRRLQDFSRQRRDQEFVELDLSEVVRSSLGALRERAPGVGVEEALEARVTLAGNTDELDEALRAVLDNAVEAGCHKLHVSLERHEDEARLIIADDGAGMSRDVRKRAFDPFYTTKGSGATGLGLSVAYGIVRRHGGHIDLESQPGHGTRVKFRLPAVRRTVVGTIPKAAAAPGRRGVRILLVEDDQDNREAMAALLGLGGHAVTAARSGSDGVRKFQTESFDIVLTDLGLPDMTGWEVARQVKELSARTPVAVITGWGLNLAQDEIRRRGVDLLIKKPIEPHDFLEQLAGLGNRRIDAGLG